MKHTWIYKKIGDITNKCQNIHWQEIDPQLSFRYVDLSSVNRDSHLIENTEKISVQTAPSRAKQIIRENDIVFGTTRPLLKRVCCIPKEYDKQICSTGFCVLRPKEYVLPHWVYYHLCTNDFYEYIAPLQTGANYPSVSDGDIRKYSIPLPPISEQQVIVAYLDDKTSKLDECVRLLELQKADLRDYRKAIISETVTRGLNPNAKLKDSGVDWIGQIPEEWKISKIGWLFSIKAGGDAKRELYSEARDKEHPYPVYTNSLDKNSVYAYTSKPTCKGNAITVTGRGDIGHAYYRTTPFDAIIRLLVLQPAKDDVDSRYYTYLIDTVIPFHSSSAAVAQLSAEQIAPYLVCFPPLSEQQEIADYLDTKTAKIDETIRRIDEQIADLRAYRTALISDVVTGKIDVRN